MKSIRPAEVGAGISRQVEARQQIGVQPAAVGVVRAELIGRQRCAVTDLGSGVRQLGEQLAHFLGEGMFGGIARPVQPPDLPARPVRGQRGQDRQHRGGTDSGGDQQDRVGAVPQEEIATWGGNVDECSGLESGVDEAADRTARFTLDADPVVGRPGRTGQRIAAGRSGSRVAQ